MNKKAETDLEQKELVLAKNVYQNNFKNKRNVYGDEIE